MMQLKSIWRRYARSPQRHLAAGVLGLVTILTCKPNHHFDALIDAHVSMQQRSRPQSLAFDTFAQLDITKAGEVKEQGISRKQLASVKLRTLTLRIEAPTSGQDLSFFASLEVFAHVDGQPDVLLAHGQDFPAGILLIGLDVEDVELKNYFMASQGLTLITRASYQGGPSNDVVLRANPTFTVQTTPAQTFCNNK